MKVTCHCDDETAAATLQNMCKMMAGGMLGLCCTMNGMMVCQCNMCMCKCECTTTKDGVCFTCTSGDKACCEMIQACCDCVCALHEGRLHLLRLPRRHALCCAACC